VGVAVSDLFTGMYATTAILAALIERAQSGRGQHIDMALLDVQVAMLANLSSSFFVSGEAPARMGNAHQNIVPYHVFRAADQFLIVAVGNDASLASSVTGARVALRPGRFATNPSACATAPHGSMITSALPGPLRGRGWLSSRRRVLRPINDPARPCRPPGAPSPHAGDRPPRRGG
jgi:formyl-CoA transferase